MVVVIPDRVIVIKQDAHNTVIVIFFNLPFLKLESRLYPTIADVNIKGINSA